jgi:hypothetical protein
VETEDRICKRYEADFAVIAVLDRRYYLTPSASVDARRDYAARQAQLEEMRLRLYAELALCRECSAARLFRRRRSFIRGFVHSTPQP